MATATEIENPSLASAKERAASILFGNEKLITPVVAEYETPVSPVAETPKADPMFTPYYAPEISDVERPTTYRSYVTLPELGMETEPQVLRPYIDINHTPSVTSAPTTNVAPVAVTTQKVAPAIDSDLEVNTQYVVKFKKSTLVTAAAVAAVFVMMAILFIVNIVSLTSAAAELTTLTQQEQTLNQELNQAMMESNRAKDAAMKEVGNGTATINYHITVPESEIYTPAVASTESGSFFNWLCNTLSHLFG